MNGDVSAADVLPAELASTALGRVRGPCGPAAQFGPQAVPVAVRIPVTVRRAGGSEREMKRLNMRGCRTRSCRLGVGARPPAPRRKSCRSLPRRRGPVSSPQSGARAVSVTRRVHDSGPRTAPLTAGVGSGYGYTESVLGQQDSHHRVLGTLLLEGAPLDWLGTGCVWTAATTATDSGRAQVTTAGWANRGCLPAPTGR